jgi:hypothetical protein
MTAEVATAMRILTFRATREELRSLGDRDLALGLLLTWIVGMGRWWEDPRASLAQHLGLGSVAYVFVLSLLLWQVIRPLTVDAPSYRNILTFVSLTAPPAVLYALPVRSWFDLATAQQLRLSFLGIVAGWRILLWGFFLARGVRFSWPATVVATLLPLTLIVVGLVGANLERVVFDFMRGVRPEEATVNDSAYATLFWLSVLSTLLFIPLALAYLGIAWLVRHEGGRGAA